VIYHRIARWRELGVNDQGDESDHNHEEDDARQIDQVVEVVGVEVPGPFPCTGWRDGSDIRQKPFEGLHLGLVQSASWMVDKLLLLNGWTDSFLSWALPNGRAGGSHWFRETVAQASPI
jgi:hypothetical protein